MNPRRDIRPRPAGASAEASPGLPQISARERDFWRRAVAAERARLSLAGLVTPAPPMRGAH